MVDVNTTFDAGKPEARVVRDASKARDLGITTRDIAAAVRALIGGEDATTYEEGGKSYDVRVRLAEQDRDRPEAVLDVPLRTQSGRLVELRNIARIEEATGPVRIDRQDRSRQITVLANLEGGKKLSSAIEDVLQVEGEIGLPDGVRTAFTGQAEMMEESFANINFSLFLAVVLIYMVLAAQFESLIHPFTVMLSLPLSIVGALGLLVLTGRTLSIFSMIGMIMLMGLVTKNAILLVDYTNTLRARGMERDDAVRRAGPVRLRPILMTALSTVAGMTPVALGLGAGAEQRAPMGTAIVGGMLTSTFLTLLVVPVVYTLMDDLGAFVRRLLFGASPEFSPQELDMGRQPAPERGDGREVAPERGGGREGAPRRAGETTWLPGTGETVRLHRDEARTPAASDPPRAATAPRESA
jgi:hydrophobic/amphiphilic exporter-1 (mainly G- bacteria), HAE1 family